MERMGSRGAWGVLAVMAIVALLGYQQYRWIVRVADAEERTNRERLEASLRLSAMTSIPRLRERTSPLPLLLASHPPMFYKRPASA